MAIIAAGTVGIVFMSSAPEHARELVALAPEVILATNTTTTQALRDATQTIPIVFVNLFDPVATGVVSNLARPGANVTGFMTFEYSLAGKWLSLLKDMAPRYARVALLFNPDTAPYAPLYAGRAGGGRTSRVQNHGSWCARRSSDRPHHRSHSGLR
jgi:ABC transporter substrate binding protein